MNLITSESHTCWHGPISELHYGETVVESKGLRVAIVRTPDGFSLHHFRDGESSHKGLALSGYKGSLADAKAALPDFLKALLAALLIGLAILAPGGGL